MQCRSHRGKYCQRRGVAAIELAALLPFIVFLFVLAADYARIFYYSVAITNCARNGALYASDATAAAQSPYTSTTQAALADATGLTPTPTVAVNSTSAYVEVTVAYTFSTITHYPGLPATVNLSHKVRMQKAPALPN